MKRLYFEFSTVVRNYKTVKRKKRDNLATYKCI